MLLSLRRVGVSGSVRPCGGAAPRSSRSLHAAEAARSQLIDLIDFGSYPIDDRESPGYDALVCAARTSLQAAGCFRLPGFVTPHGVGLIKRECLDIAASEDVIGNQVGRQVNVYYTEGSESKPDSHPVNTFFDRQFGAIRDDMIGGGGGGGGGGESALRTIYDDQRVVSFVADVMGVPKLFQSRDSYQALTVNVMKENDHLHWHFDCNACAVTLGIQVPESGGELEFVPNIGRESYDAIERVLAGDYHRTQTAGDGAIAAVAAVADGNNAMRGGSAGADGTTTIAAADTAGGGATDGGATDDGSSGGGRVSSLVSSLVSSYQYHTGEGELVFFCGGDSIHRVRDVKGDRLRLVAALQFHTSDDAFDPPDMTERIYGVPMAQHVGPKDTIVGSFRPTLPG